jgi:hypothetical protein
MLISLSYSVSLKKCTNSTHTHKTTHTHTRTHPHNHTHPHTHTQPHTPTHTPTHLHTHTYTHTPTPTPTHTHTHPHTPTHTHTHTQYVKLTAFTLPQWSHGRASVLRHTYSACLVNLVTCYEANLKCAHCYKMYILPARVVSQWPVGWLMLYVKIVAAYSENCTKKILVLSPGKCIVFE